MITPDIPTLSGLLDEITTRLRSLELRPDPSSVLTAQRAEIERLGERLAVLESTS